MRDFRNLLAGVGCEDISTYIQSGNAVFRHKDRAEKISKAVSTAIEKKFGFRSQVFVLSAKEFLSIAKANPYRAEAIEPKYLHVWFLLDEARRPDNERLRQLAAGDEAYALTGAAFYLRAPSGIGNSKLAAKVEKCLDVRVTARNWRTVCKLVELLNKLD